jgi:hypothetical protein
MAQPMPEVDSATYYDVWLDALEGLLIERGLRFWCGHVWNNELHSHLGGG